MQHRNLGLLSTVLALAALLGLCASAGAQPVMFEGNFSDAALILNGGAPVGSFPLPPGTTGWPDGSTICRGVGVVNNLRLANLADGCSTDGYGFVADGVGTGYAILGVYMDGNYVNEGGFAVTDDTIFDLSLRIDGGFTGPSGFWIRIYSAKPDTANPGKWTYSAMRNYFFNVTPNVGWQCFCKRIGDWNENPAPADWQQDHVYLFRIDSVVWTLPGGPYVFGVDHLKVRGPAGPAVTCPNPIVMQGGCVNHIVLTATCNPIVDNMGWYDDQGNLVADGLVYTNDLPVGAYNFTFKAWDSTAPCDVSSCSTPVTITGSNPTADAGGPYSYTLELCQVQDVPLDGTITASSPPNYNWEWTDSLGRSLASGFSSEPDIAARFLPGTYTVTLTVTDNNNCTSASDTATVTINAPMAGLPVSIPMNPQINHDPASNPVWDAIVGALPPVPNITDDQAGALDFYADPTFARYYLSGGYFVGGPSIILPNACYQPINVTNTYIRFEARYFQDETLPRDPPAYADAPLGIRFRNANLTDFAALGTGTNLKFFYGPTVPVSERYPLWQTCGGPVTLVDVRADRFGRTAGFDPTQVTHVEFVSTDWSGFGTDYYDIKNLLITSDPLGACCIDANTCVPIRLESECTALGGVSWHAGEDCGAVVDTYALAGASLPIEDISSTGTQLVGCDDCGYVVPLGFAFSLFGQAITDIGMASNGYLTMDTGSLGDSGNVSIPSTSVPNNLIAVLWHDWNPSAVGAFYYQTLGTAPNRRFVALWKDVAFYGETTPTNTFEAILYEGTNVIQLRYGGVNPTSGTPGYSGATTIGVENGTGTVGVAVAAETIGSGGDAVGQVFTPTVDDQRTCAAALLGDMDCSGTLTLADVPLFVDALLGTYNVPGCDVNLANMNQDANIDGLDIQPFTDAVIP